MKNLRAVMLMPDESGHRVCNLARQAGVNLDVVFVNDVVGLERAFTTHRDLLLSFETSVIVPAWILNSPDLLALNIHAASPEYPGRDPHHFAVYDGARQYGATMHYMTFSVDAGPIIEVELFDVPNTATPLELLSQANDAGWLLIKRFFQNYSENGEAPRISSVLWGSRKTTRKMFRDLCRVDPEMSMKEVERRFRATEMPGYMNLYMDFHGYRFRIEGYKD